MTKRWALFKVGAESLLAFLRLLGRENLTLRAPTLPPDVVVFDTVFDHDDDAFTLVLESESFDAVPVMLVDQEWRGDWPEIVFALDDTVPEARAPRPRPLPPPDEARWEAYFLSPTGFLSLLETVAAGEATGLDPLPPDVRLTDAFFDPTRRALALFLESDYFEPANLERDDDGGTRIGMPERWLTPEP